jgi:hypothetical protein
MEVCFTSWRNRGLLLEVLSDGDYTVCYIVYMKTTKTYGGPLICTRKNIYLHKIILASWNETCRYRSDRSIL